MPLRGGNNHYFNLHQAVENLIKLGEELLKPHGGRGLGRKRDKTPKPRTLPFKWRSHFQTARVYSGRFDSCSFPFTASVGFCVCGVGVVAADSGRGFLILSGDVDDLLPRIGQQHFVFFGQVGGDDGAAGAAARTRHGVFVRFWVKQLQLDDVLAPVLPSNVPSYHSFACSMQLPLRFTQTDQVVWSVWFPVSHWISIRIARWSKLHFILKLMLNLIIFNRKSRLN